MPFLQTARVSLHYEVSGSGPPVVLLHGFTSSFAGNWIRRGWPELLVGNGFQVVGLDFRSHGDSDRVYDAAEATTTALAADVVALLDHLDLAPVALFGFSMGGGVALKLGMDVPERVERLVIGGVGDAAFNRLHDPGQIDAILTAFDADSPELIASPLAQAVRRSADAAGCDLAALRPFLQNGGWPGGLDEQRPVTVPTLLIVAEEDQYMAQNEELARWLPHAHVERIAARDHYSVLDDEAVRAIVLRFLSRRGGRWTKPS